MSLRYGAIVFGDLTQAQHQIGDTKLLIFFHTPTINTQNSHLTQNRPPPPHTKKIKPQASEMLHYTKHHASENRRAIERSLVTVARYGVEPRRGSVMMMKKKIFTSRPTLPEAHIVYTLLSPSCVSLHAKTLAWCFASFGISDAYPNCYISFP